MRTEARLAAVLCGAGLILALAANASGGRPGAGTVAGPNSRSEPRASVERIRSVPLAPVPPVESRLRFERLPGEATGIDLVHEFPTNASFEMLTDQGSGNGVCVGDYDSDGLPDVYVANYNRGNRLYRNLGNWRFVDVTAAAGVEGKGRWCTGVTFVDIDNDGDLDLYVCVFNQPNLLYVNEGDGRFTEEAKSRGLDFTGASVMMAFADYDRDGRLDGYLVTHRLNTGTDHQLPKSSREALSRTVVQVSRQGRVTVNPAYEELFATLDKGGGRTELIIAGQRDYLFHGQGDGTFRAVGPSACISGNDIGLAATWWDFDDDGWPDLYVSNDYRGPDRLYRNQRDGSFRDVAGQALPHVPWASMGADTADVDNDGRLDLLAADMSATTHYRRQISMTHLDKDRWFLEQGSPRQYPRNALFLSRGVDRLLEAAFLTGLADTDWTWSPKFGDLDNDGWVDLFLTTGMSRDFVDNDLIALRRERGSSWRRESVLRQANLAFRNLGDLRFQNVSAEWGLDRLSASYGAALADLDRDGDLDLIVANFDEPLSVYRNSSREGHRLLVRLVGRRSNSWGVGAKVTLETAQGIQARYLGLTSGFASCNEPLLHFGLGSCSTVDRLTVRWPDGRPQVFTQLAADRLYTLTEDDSGDPAPPPTAAPAPTLFVPRPVGEVRHRESPFDDFQREPLLPWRLSRLGPGLAIGDVNGDGRNDFYLGGAAGFGGQLCLGFPGGGFRLSAQPAFAADGASEDAGVVFFDADGDGDLDLFVVSGGAEAPADGPEYQDRLYWNDGSGHFTKAPPETLPTERDAGSAAAAADFDRDGDVDLFVGGRTVPGAYPSPARSHLWINVEGRFLERTAALAPGLESAGIVTGALWTDVDNDGWLDLLLTCEWGPVRLFLNRQGRLEERTREAGLAGLLGLWNGVVAGDLDRDGAMDYVVANRGLNTRYQASPETPALLFYGTWDDTGVAHPIEAYYEAGRLLPFRGRGCLLAALPALGARFPTFASYARASLAEVFSAQSLAEARRLEVHTLESGVLHNDGRGHFTFHPLPREAQLSPVFGLAIGDGDGDGIPDLYLAQNFYGAPSDSGRMDGGMSLLLQGRGDGSFRPVASDRSGLVAPGDAKGLGAIDLNGDGWTDWVVGMNDAPPLVFERRPAGGNRTFQVGLQGRKGNPTGIGARVAFVTTDGGAQTAEVHAGSGYLSQSTPVLTFGLGQTSEVREIRIRWPKGRLSTHLPPFARTGSVWWAIEP